MTAVISWRFSRVESLDAAPASVASVSALAQTCSPGSLAGRFLLPADLDPPAAVTRYGRYLLAGPPDGAAVIATVAGVPVGLLNLVVAGEGLVEAGLLVADAWQRRGVGGTLVATELGRERWAGWTVRATVQPHNLAARKLVRAQRIGVCRLVGTDPESWDYDLTLPAAGSRLSEPGGVPR